MNIQQQLQLWLDEKHHLSIVNTLLKQIQDNDNQIDKYSKIIQIGNMLNSKQESDLNTLLSKRNNALIELKSLFI
jgi:hypothetical protein